MSKRSGDSPSEILEPILLVEDEESDAFFMQFAMEEAQVKHPLTFARTGQEALDYFQGTGLFADRQRYPLPRLVLLDLHLPYVPGLAVLKWIRDQPAFKRLPVIICTASSQDADVEAAYALGCGGYIVKPTRPAELTHIARLLQKYFLEMDAPPAGCVEWEKASVPRPSAARTRR